MSETRSEPIRSISLMLRGLALAMLLAVPIVHGCGASRVQFPVVATPNFEREVNGDREATLRRTLDARESEMTTFRAQARLKYTNDEGTKRYSQMVVVQGPDRVRIDFMTPFGPTYTVASDGSELTAYDRGAKRLYRGDPSPNNVRRYTNVPVEIPVLASLMRGLPPLMERTTAGRVFESSSGVAWSAPVKGGGRLTVNFSGPEALLPESVTVTDAVLTGDLSATFENYEDVDGLMVPHLIRTQLPDGAEIELKYSRIWRGIGLGQSAFHIDAPKGVDVVVMDHDNRFSTIP